MSCIEPSEGIVTLRLPVALDDEWAQRVGSSWRALAGRPSVAGLDLDATDLRSVSGRAVGLLTALRLIGEQRGTAVRLRGCPARLVPVFTAARLDVRPAAPKSPQRPSARPSAPPRSGDDAVPAWWISAASNA